MEYTEFQHFVHIVGTSALVLLYGIRVWTLLRRKVPVDRSGASKGDVGRAIREAFGVIVMPWRMDSTRRHWFRYAEFTAFHIGIFTTIALSFAFTYIYDWMTAPVRAVIAGLIGLGLAAGTLRLVRRIARPEMRAISSVDDYASMVFVLGWEVTGIMVMAQVGGATLAYFAIALFLLVYEPFSKLRHYIYYPFARIYHARAAAKVGIMGKEVTRV